MYYKVIYNFTNIIQLIYKVKYRFNVIKIIYIYIYTLLKFICWLLLKFLTQLERPLLCQTTVKVFVKFSFLFLIDHTFDHTKKKCQIPKTIKQYQISHTPLPLGRCGCASSVSARPYAAMQLDRPSWPLLSLPDTHQQ